MDQPVLPGSDAKRFVVELRAGERLDSNFLLRRCDLRTRQNGEPYLALEFSDKSGTISARMWDGADDTARTVKEGDYVRVVGSVETWQGRLQIKADRIEPVDARRVDPSDYLPASGRDLDEMFAELIGIVDGVDNDHLRALLKATFGDPDVALKFRRAPGGVVLHHAYVGGLLEHTLSVVNLARRIADNYASLDRDLLITGACLHDLGKIWELSYDQAFEYTEEGRLVGHLLLESNWLAARMEEIDGFPAPLKHHVLHLLASHHGLHEHGAPVRPATREALALHYADDLDSKMGAMDVAIEEAEATGADTAYSRSLGRRILRRSWKEVDD